MGQPRKPYLKVAIKVLKYLKGWLEQGLLFPSQNNFELTVYDDADWDGCPTTRRLVIGYCIYIGGSLVSWKIKETNYCFKVLCEGEISSHGSSNM